METIKRKNELEIKQLVEDWAKAVREENIDKVIAHHAEDIVMFDVPGPLQSKGITAYRKTWDLYFSWSQGSGVFDISELDITAGDDVAFCHAIMRCASKKENGEKVEFQFRLTMGFCHLAREWVVIHEHHSLPSE